MKVGISWNKVAKTWEFCNFLNFVTSITLLPKDTILKIPSNLWDFWIRVKSVGQILIFLLSFFLFLIYLMLLLLVSLSALIFLKTFLSAFSTNWSLPRNYFFGINHHGFSFSSFFITLASFGPGLTLESTTWCAFFMWSFKWNLNLNGPYGHFFCLYKTTEGHLIIDALYPILLFYGLFKTCLQLCHFFIFTLSRKMCTIR